MQMPKQLRTRVAPFAALAFVLALGLAAAACSSSGNAATSTPNNRAAAPASGQSVKVVTDAKLGAILETSDGMPLYTYDKDTTGKSNCTGGCLAEWPALIAKDGTAPAASGAGGAFSLVTRSDGSMQVAYNGLPLYTFKDDKAGQVTGDGEDGFHVAKAGAAAASSPTTAAASGNGYNY